MQPLPPETATTAHGLPGRNWTLVLRRRLSRQVLGCPGADYTDAYELVCCDCGDDPDLDYGEISPELQGIRGPYAIVAGVAAYRTHVLLFHPEAAAQPQGSVT